MIKTFKIKPLDWKPLLPSNWRADSISGEAGHYITKEDGVFWAEPYDSESQSFSTLELAQKFCQDEHDKDVIEFLELIS